MRSLRVFCAIFALMLVPVSLSAAEEPVVCEHAKLNTEDATPVDPGMWEVELSYGLSQAERQFDDDWARDTRPLLRQEEFALAVTRGLVEDLDVGFGVGYLEVYDRDTGRVTGRGDADLEVGLKWRFYHDEERRLEVAYVPGVTLPTGRREDADRIGITDDFVSIFNGIAVSKDWSDRCTSNFDLGYNYPVGEDRGDFRGALSANAALGYHVTDALQPEVELNYEHEFGHGDDADALALTAGMIICASESMRVDVGVQRSLLGRNADHATSFLAALTVTF